MIDVEDWSALYTVNYRGGFSGDFINNIIDTQIRGQYQTNVDDYNKYNSNYCVFSKLFRMPYLFFVPIEYKNNYYDLTNTNIRTKILAKDIERSILYDQIHDESDQQTIFNIKKYCFDNYKTKFNNKRITALHNHNFKYSCQQIWPNSINLKLDTLNLNYLYISIFYGFIKNKDYIIDSFKHKVSTGQANLFNDLATNFFYYSEPNIHNEKFIDVYSMLVEELDYSNYISEIFNHQIFFDKQIIKNYHQKNVELLEKFNLNFNQLINVDSNKAKSIIQNSFIDIINSKLNT